MTTRRILFGYCVLALAGLLVWIVLLSRQISVVSAAAHNAQGRADVTALAVKLGEQQVDDLLAQQRAGRLESSAEDAIKLSARIQQLQKSTQDARDEASRAASDLALATDKKQHLQLRFVPIIALLISHLTGVFVFFPKKIS